MSTQRRKKAIILLALHLIAAAVLALVFRDRFATTGGVLEKLTVLGTEGKRAIEEWCGQQLLAVARGYLNPDLSFDSIHYEYPATITLSNVKMVDEGVAVIDANSMRVVFTETPVAGQPLVIQAVELFEPVVKLIRRPQGGLLGFSNLLRKGEPNDEPESNRPPSDVFAIRRLAIINGTVEYQIPDRPPMVLNQLTFDLASTPAHEANSANAGWYAIDALFARHPLFRWKVDGGINVDSGILRFDQSKLNMKLVPDQYPLLLPDVQAFVRQHEITGELEAILDGPVPLQAGKPLQLNLDVRLVGGHIAFGDYLLPVDQLDLASRFSEDVFTVETLEYRGLGGQANAAGRINLRSLSASAAIDARDLLIDQALRSADGASQLKGKLSVSGSATADLASIDSTSDGTGRMSVTEGRLVQIPIISRLIGAIKLSNGASDGTDRASADLQLIGDRLRMTRIEIVSGPLGARGEGDVRFDSNLDFRLSAGPFEGLRNSLGGVGNVLNRVTDGLVVYYVTGTFDKPVVSVRTLGIGGGQGSSR
jgi:hypothetical protein